MGSIFYNCNNNNNNNASNHSLYSGGKGEMQFIEVWDYMGGASFRGFVAEKVGRGKVEKTLFLFFENVEGTQLKHGLIALIELATECFNCDRLVICLDRKTDGLRNLIRDFGWVGFELITLAHWLPHPSINSDASSTRSNSFSSNSSGRSGSFSSISSNSSSSSSDDDVTSGEWIFVGMEL
jgi:oligosaccharide translocation protein RFT1